MTPELLEEFWSDELYKNLYDIAKHHYYLLPASARRSIDLEDMAGDALVKVLLSVRNAEFSSQTGFEHFCQHAMRKQCQSIRNAWELPKRRALSVTSIGELEEAYGDTWVPASAMARADDMYPPTEKAEAKWTRMQVKKYGRVPLDPTIRCWHCRDPAKRSRGTTGKKPKNRPQMRLCYDPRCKLAAAHEHNQRQYYANTEENKRRNRERQREWYHTRKAKLAEARATKN